MSSPCQECGGIHLTGGDALRCDWDLGGEVRVRRILRLQGVAPSIIDDTVAWLAGHAANLWDLSLRAAAARRAGEPVVLDRTEAALFTHAVGGVGWPSLVYGAPVRIVEDDG